MHICVKDPNNHFNHCNTNDHIEDKCCKLNMELNPKNRQKDAKKKNMLAMNLSNQEGRNFDVDEKIVYTITQKEVNLITLHSKE